MSSVPTKITEEIYTYILDNFSADDEFMSNLKREALLAGFPDICISPDEARFLQFLLRTISARNVLEIGSLAGYSAITMARALPAGASLTTVDIEIERVEFIRRKVNQAGLGAIIDARCSGGVAFLESYTPAGPLDFVFIDADKENYVNYFRLAEPHLRRGGIIAADNALAFGNIAAAAADSDVIAIREYNSYVRSRQDFFTTLAPYGDGVLIAVKL